MEAVLSPLAGWILLVAYALIMLGLVLWGTKKAHTISGYHLASRDVGVLRGALSIAVSWIWAPAIFFCALKAYLQGMPGIFWFTVPNVLCFLTFALVALRMRKLVSECYSMPDFIARRFGGAALPHLAAVVVVLIIDIVAVLFNALIGAFLVNTIAGIPFAWGVVLMSAVALFYSVWRGLPE